MYKKWIPIDGIPKRLFCEAIHDDYEGFRILLRGEDNSSSMLRITFESLLAYRNIDEGNRLKTMEQATNFGSSSLYIVEDSTWIKWFNEESYGIHKSNKIIHYAIYTPNDCIDVLSEYEPKIEWL